MDRKKIRASVGILVTFALALVIVIAIARNRAFVENTIRSLGPAGPIISLVIYALLALSPLPADPLTVINGAVFGPLLGPLVAWSGKVLSAYIEYFVGAKLADTADFETYRAQLPPWVAELSPDSIWFLIFGRFITGFGSKAVSYVSGIYGVPLPRYTWTTAITNLIGAAIYALGGYGLVSIF